MAWRKITNENVGTLTRLFFEEHMPMMIAFERSSGTFSYDHKKHLSAYTFESMAEDGRFYYFIVPKLDQKTRRYRVAYYDAIENAVSHIDIETPDKASPETFYKIVRAEYPEKINVTTLAWSLIE